MAATLFGGCNEQHLNHDYCKYLTVLRGPSEDVMTQENGGGPTDSGKTAHWTKWGTIAGIAGVQKYSGKDVANPHRWRA